MTLVPVEDALRSLLADATALDETESVGLREAAGRVLARDLVALRTQPDFDASAMDGYALRSADLEGGTPLRIVGESAAGAPFADDVVTGTAVRIFTGAPLPGGADTVVIQEDTERSDDGGLLVREKPLRGANIRPIGNDFRAGALLLSAGTRLSAGAVALAASGGYPTLGVLRRPLVAILATGDELVEPGSPVGPSQIVASNGYGVAALVEANGGRVLDLGIAPDDLPAIGARIDEARDAGADILVSIGGASVGDRDLAASAFADRGVELGFAKVAMRPGKPIMAGRLGAMRVVGLPGNPASSMVAATVFLRPLLRRLAGLPDLPFALAGRLGASVPENDQRAEFMRSRLQATANGPPDVLPLARQDSSLLSIYAAAEVLLVRSAYAPSAEKGDDCLYVPLD